MFRNDWSLKHDSVACFRIPQNTICMHKRRAYDNQFLQVWQQVHSQFRVTGSLGYNSGTQHTRWDLLKVFSSNYEAVWVTNESVMCLFAHQWKAKPFLWAKIILGTKCKYLRNEIHGQFDSKYMLIHSKKWFSWMNNKTTAWDNPLPKWSLYLHCELFKSW